MWPCQVCFTSKPAWKVNGVSMTEVAKGIPKSISFLDETLYIVSTKSSTINEPSRIVTVPEMVTSAKELE